MSLVLSRKANESIKIGDGITITVTKIAGNKTSIAIEAPQDVRILRAELAEKEKAA